MGPAAWILGIFIVPLGVVGVALGVVAAIAGLSLYTSGLIYGFRRPFVFQRPAKTARLDDLNNWTVGLTPGEAGGLKGQIAFTAHF